MRRAVKSGQKSMTLCWEMNPEAEQGPAGVARDSALAWQIAVRCCVVNRWPELHLATDLIRRRPAADFRRWVLPEDCDACMQGDFFHKVHHWACGARMHADTCIAGFYTIPC